MAQQPPLLMLVHVPPPVINPIITTGDEVVIQGEFLRKLKRKFDGGVAISTDQIAAESAEFHSVRLNI